MTRYFICLIDPGLGRWIKSQTIWGDGNLCYPKKFDAEVYNSVVNGILGVLTTYGYIEPTDLDSERTGYTINSSVLEWCLGKDVGVMGENSTNIFFRSLYENVAEALGSGDRFFHQLEAREHTAQVDTEIREERETRFRKGIEDGGLPVLFLLTDNGTWHRYLHAQHSLYAKRTSNACELHTAQRTRRP